LYLICNLLLVTCPNFLISNFLISSIMFNKLKQLQDLKAKANEMKSRLAQETIEIEKSNIKILINGNQEIVYYKIENQELLNSEKLPELESALKEATNQAIQEAQKMMAQKMMSDGNFNLPGM